MSGAAIYARVSTAGQEDGTSLDTQVAACLELAHSMGYSVDDAYIWRDQGSGADPERPGLENLRAVLSAGEVQMLIAYTPDRIARDPLHLLVFRDYLYQIGVDFRFVNGPSGNSPEEQLMQYILGYVGQRERLDIAERTNRGKRRIAQDGRLPIGTGLGLYGYDYDKETKTRRVNEIESNIVRRIFHEYAEGHSFYAIVSGLNKEGIKTKRGCLWYPLTVKRILENPSYKGETWYGRIRSKSIRGGKIERAERPKSEWILVENFTPPIVSDSLFQQAQDQMAMPKARKTRARRAYLLTGFARCESCGSPLVGTSIHKQYRYYHCRGASLTSTRPKICNAKYIRADQFEELVWDHLSSMISDPSLIMENIKEYLETDGGDLRQEINRLRRKVEKAKDKERKLIQLYANDLIDTEMLNDQIAPIKAGGETLERELCDLEQQQALNEDVQMMEQRVAEYYRLISENLGGQDYEGKRSALSAFNVLAIASKENVTVNVTIDPGFPTTERTSA